MFPPSLALGAFALVAVLGVASARAQATGEEGAREAFESASRAADEERFLDAERLYVRSLELAPRPWTAHNLASVYAALGRPTRAEPILRALLSGEYGEVSDELRLESEALLVEARAAIAWLRVRVERVEAASIRIDGVSAGTARAGATLRLATDPGAHVLTARSSADRVVERAITARAGASAELTLVFPSISERSPVIWPWVAGSIALAIGIGVVVFALVYEPPADVHRDPIWGEIPI
jgi:hypothetical protein